MKNVKMCKENLQITIQIVILNYKFDIFKCRTDIEKECIYTDINIFTSLKINKIFYSTILNSTIY
jgi:hypothetical protein